MSPSIGKGYPEQNDVESVITYLEMTSKLQWKLETMRKGIDFHSKDVEER